MGPCTVRRGKTAVVCKGQKDFRSEVEVFQRRMIGMGDVAKEGI